MAEISAKLVKELRDKTGAGMMDCKKALSESGGDTTKATEWLRQKGISTAEKKSGRTAAEGAIGSYIHTGARVGVLVEVQKQQVTTQNQTRHMMLLPSQPPINIRVSFKEPVPPDAVVVSTSMDESTQTVPVGRPRLTAFG